MDFRIPQSTVEGLNEDAYFWELIAPVWPDKTVTNELDHIGRATPGQRALYVVTLCLREIDNGGLYQFFYNSSGIYASEVRQGFRLIGADIHATAFERALIVFPGSRVPGKQKDRQAFLQSIPNPRRKALFGPLEKILGDERRIWPYFHSYVDANPHEFFIEALNSGKEKNPWWKFW